MKRGTYAVEAVETAMKLVSGTFTTNNTSAPDGVDGPFTVTRDGVGTFTVTLDEAVRTPSTGTYWIDCKALGSAGSKMHVTALNTSGNLLTGFTCELRAPAAAGAAPAWTTGIAVTSDAATLASAGYVVAVFATAGSVTGVKTIQPTGTPGTGEVTVTYAAGVATLTFNDGTDDVTETSALVIPADAVSEAVADSTDEIVQFIIYARNSKLTSR